jgi:hypothetical protein
LNRCAWRVDASTPIKLPVTTVAELEKPLTQ